MHKKILLLGIFFSLFYSFTSIATPDILDDLYSSKTIELVIGEAQPLKVNNPRQVKIGNPELLDVVGASRVELLMSGLKEGETNLTVVDASGKHDYLIRIVKDNLERIKERVAILLEAGGFGNLMLAMGEYERKIFVLGEVVLESFDGEEASDPLEKVLEPVKDYVIDLVTRKEGVVPSIEIDVEVYDIKKTILDSLGFNWSTATGAQTLTYTEPSADKPLGNVVENLIVPTQYYKLLKSWGRSDALSMNFDFLESKNQLRTLARPKLVVQSGKEASFLVGGEKPIIIKSTTTAGSGSSTTNYDIEYKEFGVKLNIKPEVKEDDIIQMSLEIEISEVDEDLQLVLGDNIATPGMKKSTTSTELTVLDGQTILLAGLIKNEDSGGSSKVKGLGSIPFIGALFRAKSINRSDREVVISLKSTVIWPRGKKDKFKAAQLAAESQGERQRQASLLKEEFQIREEDPLYEYSRLMQNLINSNVKYPRGLRRQKLRGTVRLSLHLLPSGKLLGAIVMKSSGHELLDLAAEQTVKDLSPFPAFPATVKLKELWIDIPIVYQME